MSPPGESAGVPGEELDVWLRKAHFSLPDVARGVTANNQPSSVTIYTVESCPTTGEAPLARFLENLQISEPLCALNALSAFTGAP